MGRPATPDKGPQPPALHGRMMSVAAAHGCGPRTRPLVAALLLPVVAGCTPLPPEPAPPADAPYVLVLGTAQDGGLPQIGCELACCDDARRDPSLRRLTSALLLADPRTGRRWLFDAGPDLPELVQAARGHPSGRGAAAPAGAAATTGRITNHEPAASGGRTPLFQGIFLTHAHLGHVAGLLQLGREAYAARAQPVYASAAMAAFLRGNAPWSLELDDGQLVLRDLQPGRPVVLAEDLRVTPWKVPHRDEFSDTLAFLIEGPHRSLLYLPDIDKWERWDRPLEDALGEADVALIDGTFFADGEVPGRAMADIPHPFITETIARLAALPRPLRTTVLFTHLNHTNPAARPDSEAAAAVRRAGLGVAAEGQLFAL